MKLHSMTIFIGFSNQMNIYGIEPNKNAKPNPSRPISACETVYGEFYQGI